MINQVIFEGYLVKQWEYQGQRFLRLAGHRPQDGEGLVQSDYVTVQLDPAVTLDPHLHVGARLVVAGRIWGRDIVETLGRVLQKADLAVDLAPRAGKPGHPPPHRPDRRRAGGGGGRRWAQPSGGAPLARTAAPGAHCT